MKENNLRKKRHNGDSINTQQQEKTINFNSNLIGSCKTIWLIRNGQLLNWTRTEPELNKNWTRTELETI